MDEKEVKKSSQTVLSSGCIVYDDEKMKNQTIYKKGQLISEVKPEHLKILGL